MASEHSEQSRLLLEPSSAEPDIVTLKNEEFPAEESHAEGADAGGEAPDTRTFWQKWKPGLLLFLMMAINYASVEVLEPVLPDAKKRYFGSDEAAARYQSIVSCIAALIGLATAGIVGKVMDSVGRKPMSIIFLIVNAVAPATMAAAPHMPVPFMVIYSFNIIVQKSFALAYVADLYSGQDRSQAYGALKAVEGIMGFSALVANAFDTRGVSIVSTSLAVVALLWGVFLFPETLPHERRLPFSIRTVENPLKPMRYLSKSKTLISCVLIAACYLMTQVGEGEVYLYYLNQRVAFTTKDNSIAFAMAGVLMVVVYLGVMPFLLRRISVALVIFISLVALLLELVLIATLWAVWPAFAFIVPLVALSRMVPPVIYTIVANTGDPMEQGLRMAGLQAVAEISQAVGPLLFGEVFGNVSAQLSFIPFIICAAFVFPAAALTIKLPKWMRDEQQEKALVGGTEPNEV